MEIFYRWTPGGPHTRNVVQPSGHRVDLCVHLDMGVYCDTEEEAEQFERLGFKEESNFLKYTAAVYHLYRR